MHPVGWTAAGHPEGRSEAEEPQSGLTRRRPSDTRAVMIDPTTETHRTTRSPRHQIPRAHSPGGDSGMRWPDERKLHLLVHLQTPHVVRPIWEKGRSEMSKRTAEESDGNGHPDFILRGLGPINPRTGVLEMRVGQYMELELLEIPRDGQQGGKLKLVKLSNAVLHQAHKLKLPIAGVAGVLGSMILGRGFYLDSVGEFFQLYGRFEQMLGLTDEYRQPEIEREMRDRLGDEVAQHSREYERDGKKSSKPLPLYVRNTLAHSGTNPANVLGDGDLETSIRLLKDWLGQ